MRNYISLVVVAAIGMMTFVSCDKLDKGTRYENKVNDNLRITSIGKGNPNIYKTCNFSYNSDGTIKSLFLDEGEWSETYEFDYSTPGQISLGGTKVFKLNSNGLCVEYVKNADESYKYEYNAEGYMTKIIEVYQGSEEVKSNFVIVDGNVTQWSKWVKVGSETSKTEHFKKFKYGKTLNLRGIYQADAEKGCMLDEWVVYTGLFGKPCKNLCESYTWDYNEGNPDKLMTTTVKFFADGISPKTYNYTGDGSNIAYAYGWEVK